MQTGSLLLWVWGNLAKLERQDEAVLAALYLLKLHEDADLSAVLPEDIEARIMF
jgi:hypothetical protein